MFIINIVYIKLNTILLLLFQKENFLKNSFSHNIRSFLQWFSETQMFDSFIEDSLWRIKYRNICQTNLRSKLNWCKFSFVQHNSCGILKRCMFLNIFAFTAIFEKRIDEYKWELAHDGEKFSRIIGKTVRHLVSTFFCLD